MCIYELSQNCKLQKKNWQFCNYETVSFSYILLTKLEERTLSLSRPESSLCCASSPDQKLVFSFLLSKETVLLIQFSKLIDREEGSTDVEIQRHRAEEDFKDSVRKAAVSNEVRVPLPFSSPKVAALYITFPFELCVCVCVWQSKVALNKK